MTDSLYSGASLLVSLQTPWPTTAFKVAISLPFADNSNSKLAFDGLHDASAQRLITYES